MNRPDIDERLRRILTFVIESHVSLAEPVGSQYVRAAYHLSISPATIRSAMQQLEEHGLLGHPHTSAGRVPTEAGYRFYVDELMRPDPLPAPTRRSLDDVIERMRDRVEAIEEELPQALARLSRQLALLAVRSHESRRIERIELIALDGGYVVLAVGAKEGAPLTATWRPEPAPDAGTLGRATAWIRARLPVADPAALASLAERARTEAPPDLAPLLADALPRAARLAATGDAPDVRIEGTENITAQPEFRSPDQLRPLVTLLAERAALARALEAFEESPAPRVTIGQEPGAPTIPGCSIVAMGVTVGGAHGVVGVMGPVRMPYRRVVSLVSYIGDRLGGGRG
ncbi:MAG: heat-inducible transcriptional repressor HrcA [Hyphomicrobiales bacterium]